MNTPTTTLSQRLMVAIYPVALTAMLLVLGAFGGTGQKAATVQSSAQQAEVTLYGLATAAADAAA